ncbi:hypothetical protein LENED_006778 [Lentinula edodes]|uniref:Uncharacterized protein n=1 Tax=Lentinula edodes TaxID=5353 RepID=A0A1Q3ECL5_LENED|nr:hypothetical protein LENED_006778 [Lentinula edodes]
MTHSPRIYTPNMMTVKSRDSRRSVAKYKVGVSMYFDVEFRVRVKQTHPCIFSKIFSHLACRIKYPSRQLSYMPYWSMV